MVVLGVRPISVPLLVILQPWCFFRRDEEVDPLASSWIVLLHCLPNFPQIPHHLHLSYLPVHSISPEAIFFLHSRLFLKSYLWGCHVLLFLFGALSPLVSSYIGFRGSALFLIASHSNGFSET